MSWAFGPVVAIWTWVIIFFAACSWCMLSATIVAMVGGDCWFIPWSMARATVSFLAVVVGSAHGGDLVIACSRYRPLDQVKPEHVLCFQHI